MPGVVVLGSIKSGDGQPSGRGWCGPLPEESTTVLAKMTTPNDRAVLNSIFNPLLPLGDHSSLFPSTEEEPLQDGGELTEVDRRCIEVELEGVRTAEGGDFLGAVAIFTRAIQLAPHRPSPYNNRAQAHRINNNDKAALEDLDIAIDLSGGKGKSGCHALCQRGLLRRKCGDEAGARADFMRAATNGSTFASQQLVEMNPYAAMCNQMLHTMMATLKSDKPVSNGIY